MLNSDWDIKPRSSICAACQTAFHDQQAYVSALLFDAQGYRRHDHCHACWAARPDRDPSVVSVWKGVYQAPPPPAPEPLNRENVERMLRNLIEDNRPEMRNVIYILSVMLERRRVLVERDVQKRPDGATLRIYEHRLTGDTFIINDPMLDLDQLEDVRREVLELLGGGPADNAAPQSNTVPGSA